MLVLGAALFFALVSLSGGLPANLREESNDLRIYRLTGEAVLAGEIPYRDFFVEYPPGAVPAFVPPALLADGKAAFIDLFSAEMALVLVASLVLTALTARKIHGPLAWPVPALAFTLSAAALYPVALTRYDAVVALTLALAAFGVALGGRWRLLSYASLGFGAAAKLVPALGVLPLWLAERRRAAAGTVLFAGVLALFFVPALVFAGGAFLESFAYHAERGLQVESVGASLLIPLRLVEGVAFEFGAFEALGPAAGFVASLSLPVTGLLLLGTAFAAYRAYREHGEASGAALFPRYAAALILAFMLGSKVLSPQYAIWLLPLLPIALPGLWGALVCALFLAACWTTTQVFPVHYDALLNLSYPGPELLLLRNLLLALLWALLVFLPTAPSRAKEPA